MTKVNGTMATLCVLCVGLMLVLASVSTAKIDPAAIAGLWMFDEGDGDIAADASGNENHGTLVGDVKWVQGKTGTAVEFDGSGGTYIDCGNADSLSMNEQVTVMFWFQTHKKMKDMWADRQAVIGKHYLEYEVGIYMDGQLHTYTSDGAGNYDEGIMASINAALGEADWKQDTWYHVAWTLDGQHEIAYVNGIKIGEFDKAHKNTQPGTHPLEIGRRVEGGIPMDGIVDDVAVFSIALDEDTIKSIVDLGVGVVTGAAPVEPVGKLSLMWGDLKSLPR